MSRLSAPESSVLLVAESPDAAVPLASAVRDRGARRAQHTLLVPAVAHGLHRVVDPEDQCCAEAERTINVLREAIQAAAGARIEAVIGSHEPLAAIEDTLNFGGFDEVVLAIRSSRLARGVHLDLASKVRALGLPVSVVAPATSGRRAAA